MSSFEHRIRPFEADIFGLAPPSMLLCLAVEAYIGQMIGESAEREKKRRELGASWMLARLRLEQHMPVEIGDRLSVQAAPTFIEGGTYICFVDFRRGEDMIATCQMAAMAVLRDTRRIVLPRNLGDFPNKSGGNKTGSDLKRLRIAGDLESIGSYRVRYRDCDLNGHLSGANYADIICEHAGYWQGDPKLMSCLQIDFSSECLPGEIISLGCRKEGEKAYIRGVKSDGSIAFTCAYVMK
ncbi:MAG: hypothetical protein ACOX7I_09775 [Oscillospiraceae bacterium]|jgi:acyl-CoA thioesterase FadM